MALLAGDTAAVAAVFLTVMERELQLPETCPWSVLGRWASGPSFSGTVRYLCDPMDVRECLTGGLLCAVSHKSSVPY